MGTITDIRYLGWTITYTQSKWCSVNMATVETISIDTRYIHELYIRSHLDGVFGIVNYTSVIEAYLESTLFGLTLGRG